MPKRKNEEPVEEVEPKEIVTVKCGLFGKCDDNVYKKIQEDVRRNIKTSYRSQRVHKFRAVPTMEWGQIPRQAHSIPRILLPFNGTKIRKKDAKYAELRGNLSLHDTRYRSNLFVHNAHQFETSFKTNLIHHSYPRLRNFCRQFEADAKVIYQTLDSIFCKNSVHKPNQNLIKKMKKHLKYNGKGLFDINTKYYLYIELFFRLQKYNHEKGLKNFVLVPQFKHGMLHITYDSQAFWSLLRSLKMFKG